MRPPSVDSLLSPSTAIGQVTGPVTVLPEALERVLSGPTGLGSGVAHLPGARNLAAPLVYAPRPWGDGTLPPLYCPLTVRVDDELGEEVNELLVAWAEGIGLHEGRIDTFRKTGFGRLAMLTHAETDDRDRLLLAAQMNAAWWACDDYYADETDLGADPDLLGGRLALAVSAMDPPPPADEFTDQLGEQLCADPVLVALTSATERVARRSTAAQRMRVCNTSFQMWTIWNAYASWRRNGEPVPAWRYLAARQHDSFYTSMTLIDIVGGYELPNELFYSRRVHTAVMRAGTAAVLVNDLYSAVKESADELPDCNLVLLVAAERGCSLREAAERVIQLHNDVVHAFENDCHELRSIPSLELQRFLWGVGAWLGGGFEWHSTTGRYSLTPP
ncbi:family 2 encapsulin nanocompartment cargo protein terpene cyclase [Nonomuraea sp. NPDC050536]|uniref:family 2 encapsulin nanocompartment cargo protein terpene cyclase n=1 Tax=Nonomuraea sp. NPDC050536 TaxID=3364366 RepID=UPI0037CA03B4